MTPTRWQEIKRVYHAALERSAADRAAFLTEVCKSDPELRREVETLLAQDSSKTGTLDRPVWAGLALSEDVTVAPIAPGTQLGPYKIEARLGAGGMGEVFRGVDTRLGRSVAVKTSHEQFSARFDREARAISALNHPHICTLYDVGPNYLVMELCEGETLADRLKRGKLSIQEAIRYGAQIADALSAAHAKGIVHRDLKPGNIMLTKGGVKVLDFGLAKSPEDETLTASRVVMGTPAYMAPEQREGKACDARTDLYSLGLVLYEMATGKRAVPGQLPQFDHLPEKFAHVAERCLVSDPEERWQAAADVQRELKWAGMTPAGAPSSRGNSSAWWGWGVAALGFLALAGLGLRTFRGEPEAQVPTVRFNLADTGRKVKIMGLPVPAPDGSAVVYPAMDSQGRLMLWLRPLDSETGMPLRGTDEAVRPFWSPDGHWIGFFSQGKLKKVSREGASVQTIATLSGFDWAAWGERGEIVLTLGNRTPLYRIPDSGGVPQQLTKLDEARTENSHREVSFLPDGRHFFFIARCGMRENNSLYEGSLDTQAIRRVARMDSNVAYVPRRGGRGAMLLFVRDGKLFQQPYDGTNLTGEAIPLMDVQYSAIGLQADFALSLDGRVLVTRPKFDSATRLTWMDRSGAAVGTLDSPGVYAEPRISPDGKAVIFNRPDDNGGNRDVWLIEIARNIASRLTVNPANDWGEVWAPGGKGILFASDRNGNTYGRMFQKTSMDPGSSEEAVPGLPDFANPTHSSLDGRWIAFVNGKTHGGIWVARADGGAPPFQFLETPFEERYPQFSPDGKWIAYHSNESGRFEVYVRPFAGTKADARGKIQISEHGGYYATWASDGKELFFVGPDTTLNVAQVTGLGHVGYLPSPRTLFKVCPGNTPTGLATEGRNFDIAPDGKRFLFVCGDEAEEHYSAFANWTPK